MMKRTKIAVGEGSCGLAAGAAAVYDALKAALGENPAATLSITGCVGACYLEPIVDVYDADGALYRCVRVAPKDAETIAEAAGSGDYTKLTGL